MSASPSKADTTTVLEGGRPKGLVDNLVGLYVSPGPTFASIVRGSRVLVPLVVYVVLGLAFTAVWTSKVNPREFMKAQMEESGAIDRIPPERLGEIVEQQTKLFPVFAWLGPVVIAPIMIVIVAALYLFVFRFFYGTDVVFKQALAVVVWSFLAVAVVTVPLVLLTMALKGEWSVNPQTVLQANAALFLERETTPRPLYALAESLDLFSFWTLGLLSIGFAIATSRKVSSAAWGVAGLWLVYVLGKAGFAGLMG